MLDQSAPLPYRLKSEGSFYNVLVSQLFFFYPAFEASRLCN